MDLKSFLSNHKHVERVSMFWMCNIFLKSKLERKKQEWDPKRISKLSRMFLESEPILIVLKLFYYYNFHAICRLHKVFNVNLKCSIMYMWIFMKCYMLWFGISELNGISYWWTTLIPLSVLPCCLDYNS